jgi:hypothetical protein
LSQSQACLICSLTKKESNQAGGRWVNRPLSMRPILDRSTFHSVRSFRTSPPPIIGKVLLQRSSKAKKTEGRAGGSCACWSQRRGAVWWWSLVVGGVHKPPSVPSHKPEQATDAVTRPTDDDPNGSWSRSMAQGERRVLVECPLSSSERDVPVL